MTDMSYIIPNWPAPPNVKAYTTTREGGYSRSPFSSFNLASHVGDDINAVAKNREKLRHDLDLIDEPFWLNQEHSTNVVEIGGGEIRSREMLGMKSGFATVDASYTRKKNRVCVVLTADCLPILLCDKKGTVVAAVHAGWRSLAFGIVEKTVAALQNNANVFARDLLAWLGPAIGQAYFEVGKEVYAAFVDHDQEASKAFSAVAGFSSEKWLADIYLLARQRLNNCGVVDIYGGDFCTYQNEKLFFSYRRDKNGKKNNQGKTGRMASLIWLAD